ncbi:MAG TPA: carbamoyltransferase [Bryobacterales bacterium]|nr:carbamoyltransferase [Bryobacterales bacterium]
MTLILGLNAYHGDSAACILRDGKLIAAAEEERFLRVKHWAGFPERAIRYCLEEAGASLADLDHIAVNRDPRANLMRKALFAFRRRPSLKLVGDRLRNAGRVGNLEAAFAGAFGIEAKAVRPSMRHVEHHFAHLASAFFVSPFETAAVVSVDGFGDFLSAMWGIGEGNSIEVRGRIVFPHSLGLFYQAMTQYLGFWKYGDEYKVMGLAPYGRPNRMREMEEVVRLGADGSYELGLDYFRHHAEGVEMVWEGGEPVCGRIFTERLEELLGPARRPEDPIEDRHKDIAASLQEMYERAFFHLLDHVQRQTGERRLALAGGCAMNSVANGRIFERTGFRDLYVQAAAGDAGGAIGAAFAIWHRELGRPRGFVMDHAYWGPGWSEEELRAIIDRHRPEFEAAGCRIRRIEDPAVLCDEVAERIAEGAVVGWFQGRMEWGPRALGNRSILCDPRRGDMKDILNRKIKRRESFRPFAPVILREHVGEWFETDYEVPFMLQVYQIRPERRAQIPAVTHVNGSGRLQTIRREQNPLYYDVIAAFGRRTGVPVLLNTSFNENEPVVCRPEEAIDCFLRTKMDVLVLGKTVVERRVCA